MPRIGSRGGKQTLAGGRGQQVGEETAEVFVKFGDMGQRIFNECAVLDGAGGEENGAARGIAFASLSAVILVGSVLMMTIAKQAERDAA